MNTMMQLRLAYGRLLTFCGWIAGIVIFGVMMLTVANVVSRYGINRPIAGALELTEGALPLIIFLSLALTQFHGGHIRVTLLTDRLPPVAARVAMFIALLAGALLFGWAAWAGWISAQKSFAIGEMERGSIRFPVWPIKFAVCFGMLLLAIQFVIDAICTVIGITLHAPEPETLE